MMTVETKAGLKMETIFMFTVTTDYSKTVEDLLEETGLQVVAQNIDSKHFSPQKTWLEKSSVRLISFHESLPPEEIIKEIYERGYRSVDLHTLLSFDAQCRRLLPDTMLYKPPCDSFPWHFPIEYKILTLGAVVRNKDVVHRGVEADAYVQLRISNREHAIGFFNTKMRLYKTNELIKVVCPSEFLFAIQK
jgi:hypothetical protein